MNAHCHFPGEPTLAELEAAQLDLAKMMTEHNRPQFAPILQRLTDEIAKAKAQSSAMDLAQQIIDAAR